MSLLILFILVYALASTPEINSAAALNEPERTAFTPEPTPTQAIEPENTPTPSPTPVITYANVLIDPGHGGDDCGAEVESLHINEKIINMTIASRLYELLQQDSETVRVSMTRYEEATVSKPQRVEMANETADFFISIHCNTNENPLARGVSTYYQTHEGIDKPFTSEELANVMQQCVVESTGSHDRGVLYDGELYLLNHTVVPTALVEVGYLTNRGELLQLLDSSYVDLIAEGLRQGVLKMAEKVIEARR